jgi:hypothetical protein
VSVGAASVRSNQTLLTWVRSLLVHWVLSECCCGSRWAVSVGAASVTFKSNAAYLGALSARALGAVGVRA